MAISAGVEAGAWPRPGAADAAPPNARPAPGQPRLFQALLQQLEAGWMPTTRVAAVAMAPAEGPAAGPQGPGPGQPVADVAPSAVGAHESAARAAAHSPATWGPAAGAPGSLAVGGAMQATGLAAPGAWPAALQHLPQVQADGQGGAHAWQRMGSSLGGADAPWPAGPTAWPPAVPNTPLPATRVAAAPGPAHRGEPAAAAASGPLASAAATLPPAPPPPAGRAPLWLTGPDGRLTVAVWMPGLQAQDAAQLSRSLRHEAQRHGQTLATLMLNGRPQAQAGHAPNPPTE